MACFLVPAAEAAVTTVVTNIMEKREGESADKEAVITSREIKWLSKLLWGGSFLLLFEHIWHGEIVPWSPFITAMTSEADKIQMWHEMGTVGVSMALAVTAVWGTMVAVSKTLRRDVPAKAAGESE